MSVDLVSYALITLTNLKIDLSISGSTYDDFLSRGINAVTEKIERDCNRRFAATDYSNERYNGGGFDKLYLRNYPINTVSSCTIFDDTVSAATDWDDYDGYWIEPVIGGVKQEGCLYRVDTWDKGMQNIKLSFNAGYSTIPDDLQRLASMINKLWYEDMKTSGLKGEHFKNYSYTLDNFNDKVAKHINQILFPFRKVYAM